MEDITEEGAELVARVAALDIGKASPAACVRVPHEDRPGRRRQEVRTVGHDHPVAAGAAGPADLPGGDLVRDGGDLGLLETAVLPAGRHPRVLGGQCPGCEERAGPAEDRPAGCDLAGQAGRAGDAAAVFVPPPWQRELRDLCRYRRTLIQERTREKQRAEKLLEDTQIKLSGVISDIFGKSGREMLEALIAGQRDPQV